MEWVAWTTAISMPDRAGRPRGILAVVAVLQSGTQKLAKALKECKKLKGKKKRAVCDAQARRKYGAKAARSRAHSRRGAR